MNEFKSFLAPLIKSYITYQTASGKWNLYSYESNILLFDRYCLKYYTTAETLTQDMIDGWCKQRETETNKSCGARFA